VRVPGLAGLRPTYRRVLGAPDPLRLFERLYGAERYGFLYESLEEHGGRGRFSFLGGRPLGVFRAKNQRIRVDHDAGSGVATGRVLDALRAFVGSGVEALPVASFPGGAVGYLGYDFVRELEPVGIGPPDDLGLPDAFFLLPREVLVVDHLDQVVHLLRYGEEGAIARLGDLAEACARSEGAAAPPFVPAAPEAIGPVRSNLDYASFAAAVEQARRHILDGDSYQIVLSRRFEFQVRSIHCGSTPRSARRTPPRTCTTSRSTGCISRDRRPRRWSGSPGAASSRDRSPEPARAERHPRRTHGSGTSSWPIPRNVRST